MTSSSSSAAVELHKHDEYEYKLDRHPLYPKLLSPLDLGECGILPNRILMGSMHTGLEGHSIPGFINNKWVLGGLDDGGDDDKDKHHPSLYRMAEYFKERAEGGCGLIVTGGISPNKAGWTSPFGAKLSTQAEMKAHKVVTDAVHSVNIPIYGSKTSATVKPKICLQILHTGRYAYHPFSDSPSSTKSPITPFKAWEMSKSRIKTTVGDFITCAKLAQQAKYDGVEIMGSEGYLINQFLSLTTNLRKDEYSCESIENRIRFPIEIVKGIREACGSKFIIIFRISLLDLIPGRSGSGNSDGNDGGGVGGMTFNECCLFAKQLQDSGVTILNTGIGWHEARIPTIAPCVPRGAFSFITKRLKEAKVVTIPLVSTNRINMPQIAEQILEANCSDLISMARPLLADSQFIQKAITRQSHLINTCIGCNQACLDYAFMGKTVSCLVNPRACNETYLKQPKLLPPAERLNIGVVGSGPAGCAFAITACQFGHSITIFEQDSKDIGGQLNLAKCIPGKEEFYETIRYYQNQLKELRVEVKLNTKITYKDLIENKKYGKFDKWIIATGVTPRNPNIPIAESEGETTSPASNVLTYIDVLKHKKPVGKRVAIIGAGGIGFDVAEYLLHKTNNTDDSEKTPNDVLIDDYYKEWGIDTKQTTRGGLLLPLPATDTTSSETKEEESLSRRQIYLLQRSKGKFGKKLGKTTGWIHRLKLKRAKNFEMINSITTYDLIDKSGNLHYTRNGQQHVLEVDTIVLCCGQVENNELPPTGDDEESSSSSSASNKDIKDNIYVIGGAYKAKELDAKYAIDTATRLAYKLHLPNVIPGKHIFEAPTSSEEQLVKLLNKFMF